MSRVSLISILLECVVGENLEDKNRRSRFNKILLLIPWVNYKLTPSHEVNMKAFSPHTAKLNENFSLWRKKTFDDEIPFKVIASIKNIQSDYKNFLLKFQQTLENTRRFQNKFHAQRIFWCVINWVMSLKKKWNFLKIFKLLNLWTFL